VTLLEKIAEIKAMHGVTHERMARILFPEMDRAVIERVNRAIDSPTSMIPSIEQGRIPGMNYKGHRKYGHDLFSAGMLGYFNGGPAGLKAAWTHLYLDMMRDQIVKNVGYEGANFMEAMWNYLYGQSKRR
jgi:hypothetical protein